MLKFKNKRIIYTNGKEEVCVLFNTTVERYEQLKNNLFKKYGNAYGLSEVKKEILNID